MNSGQQTKVKYGTIDQAGHKENFLMANEYYDFIEFLQNEVGFEQVYEWQEKFEGSFTKPNTHEKNWW